MTTTKRKAPKLVRIPIEEAERHECPGINDKDTFLCKIAGRFYAGEFSRQWYGWNFDAGSHGIQFDAPGWNASEWEEIWKIVP